MRKMCDRHGFDLWFGMRRVLLLLAIASVSVFARPCGAQLQLWYQEPAASWEEALPIGNGSIGAMVFGGTAEARFQFNHDTLWAGEPHDYAREGAVEHLGKIRELLFAGKQREAEQLAMEKFMSDPLRQSAYQPFGDLVLQFPGHESVQNYRRQLDLDQAMTSTTYEVDGVRFTRTAFASHPDQAIVIHLKASEPEALNFAARFSSPHKQVQVVAKSLDRLSMTGVVGDFSTRDVTFAGKMKLAADLQVRSNGKLQSSRPEWPEEIRVVGAQEAVLILAPATSFRSYQDISADAPVRVDSILSAVKKFEYQELLTHHLTDYQHLFHRVKLDLGSTTAAALPTADRILQFAQSDDPSLATLLFQYGRYLMIASSRPGGQPANLQGLWNPHLKPPWESKYTININTEMNYWLTESTNLAECGEPLFQAVSELAQAGQSVAREHYGAGGWVTHHNFDLWRGCAPINHSNHGIWPTGGAWLCQHLWWHYQYGGDAEFLSKTAYPAMKGAAQFFLDYLIEDPRQNNADGADGEAWLISGPSNSPETGGLVMGPTMDHQIIRELFHNTTAAAEVLEVDEEFRQQLRATANRIAPNQIGQHGQLQEWLEDKDDPNNKHRHVSHLWGLHPGSEITPDTPKLFEAAKQSLRFRGDGGTGWSRAWKINFWARLRDGDHAFKMIQQLIRLTGSSKTEYRGGGMYPNLLDAHPPFQIDGNFGAANGILEMLVQNHMCSGDGGYFIDLLPALPTAWPDGELSGVRTRGGLELGVKWKDHKLQSFHIHSSVGGVVQVRCSGRTYTVPTQAGQTYTTTVME